MRPLAAVRKCLLLAAAVALAPGAVQGQAVEIAARTAEPERSLLDRPARLSVERVPLRAAVSELAERSGVPLAYSPTLLPGGLEVSCPCEAVTLRDALTRLLAGTSFTFREADGQVVIAPAAPRTVPEQPGPRLAVDARLAPSGTARPAFEPPAVIQPATITGRVTSEAGAAVGGAFVTLPGLGLATVTNEAGMYRLVVPEAQVTNREETLRVERIGYRTADVTFLLQSGSIRVDVTLTDQAIALGEIIVSGTAGNLERRAQSAVVSTIDASQLVRRAPVRDVTQMLAARVPGMNLTQSSGATGSAARINIRGAASISLSNQPLVFVDGVRVDGGAHGLINVSGSAAVGQAPSALNDINPADIESIEIVKGPAAATLYGADASAGVIQIITKRGRVGASSFAQDVTFEHDVIDPNFEVPSNYARCPAALVAPNSPNPLCRGLQEGAVVSDNPAVRLGAFSRGSANTFRYSVRGGGQNYGFFGSLGITDEQGTMPNNKMKQRSGRVNFTFAPTSTLTFDAGLTLIRSDYDMPRSDQDNHSFYLQSILGSPLTVTEGPDGSLQGGMLFSTASKESITSIVSRVSSIRTTPTLQVTFRPASWFSNRLTLGADLDRGRGFQMFPRNDFGWYPDQLAAGNGSVSTVQIDSRRYTVDYIGNISTVFGSEGQFSSNLSFGSQFIHEIAERLTGGGAGLVTNSAILVTNTASSTVSQGYGESKALGLFVQEQIGYRDRLFAQFGLRADRNSAFGSNVGTFYLPKVGASWVVSEEDFFQPLTPVVSTLRLRGAWGTTGRSPSATAALRTYGTARYVTDAGLIELGIVPGNPGNPDLRPERGKELELGFDAGFFDDRIGGELTFFSKKSTDLLVTVPVSPSTGFGSAPYGNIGEVLNRGVEFVLRGSPVRSQNFAWDLSLAGSTLYNEIVDLGTAGTFINNFRAFVPGRQIAAWWVHRVREVDTERGVTIVSDTAEFAGNQMPTFTGSLASTFTIKGNLSIYTLFTTRRGYHVYNLNQEFRDRSAQSTRNVVLGPDEGGYSQEERLRKLGPYVSETTGAPVGAGNVKDPYIQKGDHIRFEEFTATLTLPAAFAQRLGAQGASISIGGRNLALWAPDFEGDDPDVLGTGPEASGLNQLFNADVFTTPPARRWIFRMNLQF